jgi:hypothetical protein
MTVESTLTGSDKWWWEEMIFFKNCVPGKHIFFRPEGIPFKGFLYPNLQTALSLSLFNSIFATTGNMDILLSLQCGYRKN